MRVNTLFGLLLAFFFSLAAAVEQEHLIDILAWPLSAPKAQTLAKLAYNSTAGTVKSFDGSKIPTGDDVVRIGFYHPSGSWSGIATSASNFAPGKDKKLQLHVNGNGELYHLGFSTSDLGTSSSTSNSKDGLSVEVVKIRPGPVPQLSKPIVTKADGSVEEKEPEKSFFQKYWWAIAGFILLQVVMSAGKGD